MWHATHRVSPNPRWYNSLTAGGLRRRTLLPTACDACTCRTEAAATMHQPQCFRQRPGHDYGNAGSPQHVPPNRHHVPHTPCWLVKCAQQVFGAWPLIPLVPVSGSDVDAAVQRTEQCSRLCAGKCSHGSLMPIPECTTTRASSTSKPAHASTACSWPENNAGGPERRMCGT